MMVGVIKNVTENKASYQDLDSHMKKSLSLYWVLIIDVLFSVNLHDYVGIFLKYPEPKFHAFRFITMNVDSEP